MSYSEYTWQTGETITAEKLNNMENGITQIAGNLPVCITTHYDNATSSNIMDKTYQELYDLVSNGIFVYVIMGDLSSGGFCRQCPILYIGPNNQGGFNVVIGYATGNQMFYKTYFASNENEYPKIHED